MIAFSQQLLLDALDFPVIVLPNGDHVMGEWTEFGDAIFPISKTMWLEDVQLLVGNTFITCHVNSPVMPGYTLTCEIVRRAT